MSHVWLALMVLVWPPDPICIVTDPSDPQGLRSDRSIARGVLNRRHRTGTPAA